MKPKPMKKAPKCDTVYYVPCITEYENDFVQHYTWNDDYVDHGFLKMGMCFRVKKHATFAGKAMYEKLKEVTA